MEIEIASRLPEVTPFPTTLSPTFAPQTVSPTALEIAINPVDDSNDLFFEPGLFAVLLSLLLMLTVATIIIYKHRLKYGELPEAQVESIHDSIDTRDFY